MTPETTVGRIDQSFKKNENWQGQRPARIFIHHVSEKHPYSACMPRFKATPAKCDSEGPNCRLFDFCCGRKAPFFHSPRAPLEMKLTAILAVACLLVAAAYAVDPRMINARRADPYTIQDPGSLPTPHHLSSMLLLHCA
jgi:hypothetical protein